MLHLDLFSGIGGFALATERAFGDVEHIFVENDPFCQLVLKKHWPNSHIHGDIRTFTPDAFCGRYVHRESQKLATKRNIEAQREPFSSLHPPFILTGGFPCQPFSQAGRRRGTEDDRHLWPEMLRVIRDWQPTWVIAENVRGLLTWSDGLVLEQVCADLEASGYEVQPLIIPAVAKNAPHRRDRIWFVAHARSSEYRGWGRQEGKAKSIQGISGKTRHVRRTSRTDKTHNNDANPERTGHKGKINQAGQGARYRGGSQQSEWDKNWFEVATKFCRVDDGLPRRLDRNPRLKALGNAIVPAVAEEIMRAIINQ